MQQNEPCPCYRCTKERTDADPDPLQYGLPVAMVQMFLCQTCGNKRCPHAADHNLACTGSNAPGQPGSLYENVPIPPASQSDEVCESRGTTACPVCAIPYPHGHTKEELKDRPHIDGCRLAFEKIMGPLILKYRFSGIVPNYPGKLWVDSLHMPGHQDDIRKERPQKYVNDPFPTTEYGWATRIDGQGNYFFPFVQSYWEVFRAGWLLPSAH